MTGHKHKRRIALLAACAILAAGAVLVPRPAAAQFVCDSTTPGGADGATATGAGSFACGTNADAVGTNTTAVGTSAGTIADIGNVANSAFGAFSGVEVTGDMNTAVGVGSGFDVTGDDNVGVGNAAGQLVTGAGNTASGAFSGSSVVGDGNAAFGTSAGQNVTGSNNVAIGTQAGIGITASDTISIGTRAVANFDNSAAFGTDATATRANQQAFGTASNTYTMAGIATQASRDAQSGPVYLVTSDSDGNLATTSFDVTGFQGQIDELGDGVAMALALGGAFLPAGKSFALSANVGTFEGSSALGVSAVGQVHDNLFLNAGAGYGFNNNSFGGRAGVTLAW